MAKLLLSLDGGGIRGAATTQFLSRIDNALHAQHALRIRDCVDFYAGTSTGSIIALALATTDLSMSDINRLYSPAMARKIFRPNRGLFEFDGINAPKYEASGKTAVLAKYFGEASLADAVARDRHVLAVAYGVENRRPYVLKTTHADHLTLKSRHIADASSAAPTFFPTRPLTLPPHNETLWLVDGGVIANNPAMCGIAEARRLWPTEPWDGLRVLSVGTGYRTRKINGPDSRHWGAIGWMTQGHLIDVLSDERVVAYQALTMSASGNYIRVNSEMRRQPGLPAPPDDAMDDISEANIAKLKVMGDFWYERYGEAVVALLADAYDGPSLDRIDPASGQPVTYA